METSHDAGAFEWLCCSVFCSAGHESWHFVFCDFYFFSSEVFEGEVFDFVVLVLHGFCLLCAHVGLGIKALFINAYSALLFCFHRAQRIKRGVVCLSVSGVE